MKTSKYLSYIVLCTFVLSLASCEPRALTEEDVFATTDETELDQILKEENAAWGGQYRIYSLNEFCDVFMSEEGDFPDSLYRTRSTNGNGIFLFSIDTIKTDTIGIYIRGRVTTDDFGGNFYKAMVIQQAISWWMDPNDTDPANDLKQQNLRISLDMGSSGGLYQIGQEILIRCNGLAIGRYANQPQLCVPSYNNNIYASSANQKVGWAPGRIPAAKFRNAVRMIGAPDASKLIYDECTLSDLRTKRGIKFAGVTPTLADMKKVRYLDGRLVRIKNICFSGEYFEQDGSTKDCIYAHPDSVKEANVFAPTTGNVGYPQSRVMSNKAGTHLICCGNSEYCKFSNFFLPGAAPTDTTAVMDCKNWFGTVSGILSWYFDNAAYWSQLSTTNGKEWSVTPRGIPGIGISDLEFNKYRDPVTLDERDSVWTPREFDPVEYQRFQKEKQDRQDEKEIVPPIYWPEEE